MKANEVKTMEVKRVNKLSDKEPRRASNKGVRNFSDFVPYSNHVALSDLDGQTIYIVKLEPMESENFGHGYKIYFKDLPNAQETQTAASFSKVLVPVLDEVYRLTHEGREISLTSSLKAKVVVSGRTVNLE